MNQLIKKSYLLFFLAVPIVLLIGFLGGEAILDINILDTYYLITYRHLAILISILLVIIGMGYWLLQKVLKTFKK
jgi:cytochrome c oxidase subunit 1